MHFQVGIDDFGTATQESEGWTIVCLPEPQAVAFADEAPALLAGGLKKFHGKDFSRKSEGPFRDFLMLLKTKCEESNGGFITCTLNSKNWHGEFTAFAERVLEQSFLKVLTALLNRDKITASPGTLSLIGIGASPNTGSSSLFRSRLKVSRF